MRSLRQKESTIDLSFAYIPGGEKPTQTLIILLSDFNQFVRNCPV